MQAATETSGLEESAQIAWKRSTVCSSMPLLAETTLFYVCGCWCSPKQHRAVFDEMARSDQQIIGVPREVGRCILERWQTDDRPFGLGPGVQREVGAFLTGGNRIADLLVWEEDRGREQGKQTTDLLV